jgi:hypothetical protein
LVPESSGLIRHACHFGVEIRQTVGVSGRLLWHPAVETTSVSDSANTTVVLVVTFLLVVAGAGLTALAYWYWKSTIPDPESLGPLHSMSSRSYTALDVEEQRRSLDALRPSLANIVSSSTSPRATDEHVPDDVDHGDADEVVDDRAADDVPMITASLESPVDDAGQKTDDDDQWPGDDWSDLDELQSRIVVSRRERSSRSPQPRRVRPTREVATDQVATDVVDDESSPVGDSAPPWDPLIG